MDVLIDTPRGSRVKYKHHPDRGLYIAHKYLPLGLTFPVNFGFIPGTLGEDGDPLDVAFFLQETLAVGCLVRGRLIGVIEGMQKEGRESFRNDRLIAVPVEDKSAAKLRSLSDLKNDFVDQLEQFFVVYNQVQGREFKPLGRHGKARAQKLLDAGLRKK
jgi:inorganic pyrophosphatase